MSDNKKIYLSIAMIYPMLLFILFYSTGLGGGQVPFSLDAFIAPYFGANGLISSLLLAIALIDAFMYFSKILPIALADEKQRLLGFVFPELIAIFGFLIGFLENNPWAALPYFALAFAIYVYAYFRVAEIEQF